MTPIKGLLEALGNNLGMVGKQPASGAGGGRQALEFQEQRKSFRRLQREAAGWGVGWGCREPGSLWGGFSNRSWASAHAERSS